MISRSEGGCLLDVGLLRLTRIAKKWGEFRISLQVTFFLMYIQGARELIYALVHTLPSAK